MVQKTIMDKLDLSRDIRSPNSEQTNTRRMLARLQGKKFLLLLDDIWYKRDLSLVGVPLQSSIYKQSIVVCGLMDAQQKIEVRCLTPREGLHLFQMKVGEAILNSDPEISKLAEDMAVKCNGLSLVLITVGSTMASRNDRHEWVRI